jgi:queuine tRNA-ribosyltransferase
MQLRRSVYKFAEEALDSGCDCLACKNYSRAYLHHLIKSDEPLGWHLLVTHNLAFYHRLMANIRASIIDGTFGQFYKRMQVELARDDEDNPGTPPKRNLVKIPRLGDYEMHLNPKGFASIRQISSGEIMHSVNPPAEEANRLYIEQSKLAERLLKSIPANNHDELVVWDVGLGAASNAMAAVRCFETLVNEKPADELRHLKLISFECDLDPLALACRNNRNFPHLHHGAPTRLLEKSHWQHSSGLCTWELCKGDFLELFPGSAVPDLVFFDPFSAKTDKSFWTYETFARLKACFKEADTLLFTYSTSTAVRAALLSAGFYVGTGIGTGPKESTTVAFSSKKAHSARIDAPPLLGNDWLERWRRSGARYPAGLADDARADFGARIENHEQFNLNGKNSEKL